MSRHRVVCVSHPTPVCSAHDVLAVCHGFPERNAQADIGGKLLCLGEQYILLLEGDHHAVLKLAERIRRDAPEAGMTVRWRETSDNRAFPTWSIGDVYLDEIAERDPAAAEELGDLIIDLLADPAPETSETPDDDETADEPRDAFAAAAALLDRFAWTPGRPAPVAQVEAA